MAGEDVREELMIMLRLCIRSCNCQTLHLNYFPYQHDTFPV